MKTIFRILVWPVSFFSLLIVFQACQKEDSLSSNLPVGKDKISIYLTDGPYDFQKVLIQIKSIEIKIDTCHRFGDKDDEDREHRNRNCEDHDGDHDNDHRDSVSKCETWINLNIQPGIYDLLKLRNGLDTLLGAAVIPRGKIKKARILLGGDNSIMADSITRPLKIRDNKMYVTVNIRNEHLDCFTPNQYNLIIDFNLAKSIRFDNNVYWLKPEISVFAKKNTGSIKGRVRPDNGYGLIKAYNATDTGYALPDREHEGNFKIRGLKEGVYTVWIDGINDYKDSTITNVKVYPQKETEIPKIILHK